MILSQVSVLHTKTIGYYTRGADAQAFTVCITSESESAHEQL